MATNTIAGAHVKLYIGGTLYKECQSVSYSIDYGEEAIYGVDSIFPQEISTSRITTSGTVSGIRIKASGGLQSKNARPRILDSLRAPYTSVKIVDVSTGFVLFYCQQVKVTSESMQISAKGLVRVSFSFKGVMPLSEIDVYDPMP